ncbi:tol-pal system YbgF family protein, partial [Candidatus Margulisiibacteriota bacterium]
MSSTVGLSDTGKTSLSQIAYIRDLLDYYVYLKESDKKTAPSAPLEPAIAKIFRDQGVTPALVKLLEDFNSKPQDVKTAAKLFGIEINEAAPSLKASELGAAALKAKADSSDLKAALKKIKNSTLSSAGKKTLAQILYVRDFLDYYLFLKDGDKSKGISTPLSQPVATIFVNEGVTPALIKLLDDFNSDPQDVKAAAKLFGMDIDKADPKLKAFELSNTALPVKNDSADLKIAICKIDPDNCLAPSLTQLVEEGKVSIIGAELIETETAPDPEAGAKAKIHYNEAVNSYAIKDYPGAIKGFLRAYENSPHPNCLLGVVRSYLKLGDLMIAGAYLKDIETKHPDFAAKNPDKISALKTELAALLEPAPLTPPKPKPTAKEKANELFEQGYAAIGQGDHKKALKFFQKAEATYKSTLLTPQYKDYQARCYKGMGQIKKALKLYEEIEKKYVHYAPEMVALQISQLDTQILDNSDKVWDALADYLPKQINRIGHKSSWESSGKAEFFVSVTKSGQILLGTSKSQDWIIFGQNFQVERAKDGTPLSRKIGEQYLIQGLIYVIFESNSASLGKTELKKPLYFKVEVSEVSAGASQATITLVNKKGVNKGLKFAKITGKTKIYKYNVKPPAGKATAGALDLLLKKMGLDKKKLSKQEKQTKKLASGLLNLIHGDSHYAGLLEPQNLTVGIRFAAYLLKNQRDNVESAVKTKNAAELP